MEERVVVLGPGEARHRSGVVVCGEEEEEEAKPPRAKPKPCKSSLAFNSVNSLG